MRVNFKTRQPQQCKSSGWRRHRGRAFLPTRMVDSALQSGLVQPARRMRTTSAQEILSSWSHYQTDITAGGGLLRLFRLQLFQVAAGTDQSHPSVPVPHTVQKSPGCKFIQYLALHLFCRRAGHFRSDRCWARICISSAAAACCGNAPAPPAGCPAYQNHSTPGNIL